MKSNVEKGRIGENIAAAFLQNKGMQMLERNYRAGNSEIDLIMRDNATTVFVEVKSRSSQNFGRPALAVTLHKQQMIIRGAFHYCAENNLFDKSLRFDVVEVDLRSSCVLEHIENAFLTSY